MNTTRYASLLLAVAALGSRGVQAQSLEERVAAAPGRVAFDFAVHDNVCGDGNGIHIADDASPGWNVRRQRSGVTIRHRGDDGSPCEIAPARAIIEHEGRRVTSVRVTVGGPGARVDRFLGNVTAEDAARFLLAVAPELDGRSADDAIVGANIADVPRVWPRLLEIARDAAASERSRKSAIFWLSHEAGEAAVAGLADVAEDDEASTSVRQDAVFHLAQRKDGSGIEPLIRIVRKSKSAKIRKDALWHLGQSRDPRALALFAELLAGR